MITQPFTAVTTVCLYSKFISVYKAQKTGGQQVGENITDGGTMLMKRARGKKNVKKKGWGGRARQRRRRDGREAKGSEEERTCLFPWLHSAAKHSDARFRLLEWRLQRRDTCKMLTESRTAAQPPNHRAHTPGAWLKVSVGCSCGGKTLLYANGEKYGC